MQNEFEKQVKQKMEELDFVPSMPVWEKIEAQIRHKKERRRIVLWLPLILLLAGGGITWFVINDNKGNSIAIENNTKDHSVQAPVTQKPESEIKPDNTYPIEDPAHQDNSNIENFPQASKAQVFESKKKNQTVFTRKDTDRNLTPGEIKNTGITSSSKSRNIQQDQQAVLPENEPGKKKVHHEQDVTLSAGKQSADGLPWDSVTKKETITIAQDFIEQKPVTGADDSKKKMIADSVAIESVKPAVRTFGKSAWKLGVVVNAGVSGTVEGLSLPATKSYDYAAAPNSAPPPPPSLYSRSYRPSEMKNKISFGAGFTARKQLNQRFAFLTGLQYQYMSTTMRVGNRRSTLSVGSSFNNQDYYMAASVNDYTNHFHFISVPVAMEFQLLKKKPLHIQGGVSYQHMVSTNLLHFDYASQLYYRDSRYINKGQFFTDLGMNYSFPLKGFSVATGPYVQYSTTDLEENSRTHYLFAFGIRTRILIK